MPRIMVIEKETDFCMIFFLSFFFFGMIFFIGDEGKLIISKLLKGENLEFLLFLLSIALFGFTVKSVQRHI